MKFLVKTIVALFLTVSALFGKELSADGWAFLDQPVKSSFETTKDDPSIWVVFRKTVGPESFLVRFPTEPVYQMVEGRFEASAVLAGEEFQLVVSPRVGPLPESRVYQIDGKWVSEEVKVTDEHTYLFRTVSERPQPPTHPYFVSSFSL